MEVIKPVFDIGDAATDIAYNPGKQGYPDTCAIKSQELIIREFTGRDPGEANLVEEATENRWYTPGHGTDASKVGLLLENHGIPCHRSDHASVFSLADELAQGHKVIVGVNAEKLWYPSSDPMDAQRFRPADHALVVSGIDTSDPAHPHVIVVDPGTGSDHRYSMDQFVSAWSGSDFFYVATDQPAPVTSAGMQNFDYTKGHVDHALGMSYDSLHEVATNPEPHHFDGLKHTLSLAGYSWVVDLLDRHEAHALEHDFPHPPNEDPGWVASYPPDEPDYDPVHAYDDAPDDDTEHHLPF